MSTGKLTAAEARHSERHDPLDSGEDHRWHDLVSQLGVEIAEPLTAALERIHGLTATGKKQLAASREYWSRFAGAVFKVLETAPANR